MKTKNQSKRSDVLRMVIYAAQSSALFYGVHISHGDPHSVLQHDPYLASFQYSISKIICSPCPAPTKVIPLRMRTEDCDPLL